MKNKNTKVTAPTPVQEPDLDDPLKSVFDEIIRDQDMDTEVIIPDDTEDKKRSPLSIVVVTAIEPGSLPSNNLQEAMSSFFLASGNITADLSWIIVGGHNVDYKKITKITGQQPQSPGTKIEPGEVMVIQTPGLCTTSTAKNVALMSIPENSWMVNLDIDTQFDPHRLAMVNDMDHLDFHLCAVKNLTTSPGHPEEESRPYPALTLTHGWFDRSRINGGGVLDVNMSTLAIRARVLKDIGGYPGVPYGANTILAKRLDENGYQGAVTDKIGYHTSGHGYDGPSENDHDNDLLINFWTD